MQIDPIKDLESLISSKHFKSLQGLKEDFNLFKVFSDSLRENAYSRFLSYLFSSKEKHGLGQEYVRTWFHQVSGKKLPGTVNNSYTQAFFNWRTSEGRYLDILVQVIDRKSNNERYVFGIETKLWTEESENQVSDYQKAIKQAFPKVEKSIVYLSPFGKESMTYNKNSNCKYYKASFDSITKTNQKIKLSGNNREISILLDSMSDFIENELLGGGMNKQASEMISKLEKDETTSRAIQHIRSTAPFTKQIRSIMYEDVVQSVNRDDRIDSYVFIEWCYPKSKHQPHEYNFALIDLEEKYDEEFSIYYMFYSTEPPRVGTDVTCYLMAYGEKGKKCKRSKELQKIINEVKLLPPPKNQIKQWGPWSCLWAGNSYRLQDLGKKDIEGLTDLFIESVNSTIDPLVKVLSKHF